MSTGVLALHGKVVETGGHTSGVRVVLARDVGEFLAFLARFSRCFGLLCGRFFGFDLFIEAAALEFLGGTAGAEFISACFCGRLGFVLPIGIFFRIRHLGGRFALVRLHLAEQFVVSGVLL